MTAKRALVIVSIIVMTFVFFISTGTASAETICGTRPSISLFTGRIQWASYSDYVNQVLSVEYTVANTAAADATGLVIIGARSSGGVTRATPMPMALGSLPEGATSNFTIQYNIPYGIASFNSVVLANAEDGCGNIYVYPAPAQQVRLQVVANINDPVNLSYADGLFVEGNYAYIVSGVSNSLSIIDISDPYAPRMVSSLTDVEGRLSRAWGVHISGNYAYVIAGFLGDSDRLTIVDISDRSHPFIVGSLQDLVNLDGGLHVDIEGNYAYLTAPYGNRMSIIDISVPQNPRLVSSIRDDVKLYRADGIMVSGGYAYVASHQIDGGYEKAYLNAIDISDPANPTIVSSLNSSTFRGGDQMDIIGNYLYVTGCVDHTLNIVDISNPLDMNLVSYVNSDSYVGNSSYVDAADRLAFLTSMDTNRITAIDIADSTIPQIIASLQDPVNLPMPVCVASSGRFVYVSSLQGAFTVIEVVTSSL